MQRSRQLKHVPIVAAIGAALIFGAVTAVPGQETVNIEYGGELTVAIQTDLRESDAFMARISVDKMVMGSTVYDALFVTDENGNSTPSLATQATPSEDLLTWTIDLRKGVTFHNGSLFTAQDVKENIEAYLDPDRGSNLAGDLAFIESVEVTGEYQVEIHLKSPSAHLPSTFTDNIFMVDLDDYNPEAPVGTGPYKWEGRLPGDHISFTRYEDHWRGRPPLDRVVFRVIPDPLVAALELQNGGVDIVPNYVATDAIPVMREDEEIDLYETSGTTIYQAFLNFEKARNGAYEDPEAFRQGMAYLWNAQEIVPPIIGAFGQLATQVIPPSQPAGHDESIEPWPYLPERGKELLAQAGIEEGDEIYLLVWMRPYNCDHATAFASQLADLGYEPRLECIRPEAAVDEVQAYDWDLLFARTSGRPTAYQMYSDRWRMGLATPPDDFYTLQSEELEETIDQMAMAVDPEEYELLGERAAQIIVKEEIAMLPGYWDTVRVAARSDVEGIKVSPTVWYGFLMNGMTTVYLDDDE